MAHRALVAYERPGGRYDVHTSSWGGLDCRLARAITSTDPYAGGDVDPVPRVVARPFDDVLTMVDLARHEAVYRVGLDYEVEVYLPLWFAFEHYLAVSDGDLADAATDGLLVAVEHPGEAADFREWFRAVKGVLADAVAAGALAVGEATNVLERATRRRAGDREVFDPGAAAARTGEY